MKKIISVVSVLCVFALLGVLSFARAEQYRVGDAEISEAIQNLEIEWTSGRVTLAYHAENTVEIQEKSAGTLRDSDKLRWVLDGDTLRILHDQPGLHLFSFTSPKKELTVTLPEGTELGRVRISATSADIVLPELRAEEIRLATTSGDQQGVVQGRKIKAEATSGDTELRVTNVAEEITLSATSGNITLESAGVREKLKLNTTSGTIRAAVQQADQFKAGTTSGGVQAYIGEAGKAQIEATSGTIYVEIMKMDELKINATSGSVTAYLPALPGFTARVETASGRVQHTLPMAQEGKAYVCGDGSGSVKISTTSGGILIGAKEN